MSRHNSHPHGVSLFSIIIGAILVFLGLYLYRNSDAIVQHLKNAANKSPNPP